MTIANKEDLKTYLEKEFPPIIARTEVVKLTGGMFHTQTLANEDSRGEGPKNPIKLQKKVGYTKDSLIEWILGRVNFHKEKNKEQHYGED